MKKYERLEIKVAQWPEHLTDLVFDDTMFQCTEWPGTRLHIWRGDETAQDTPAHDGLSERGLQMCLSALDGWQAEHPDKKIELQSDAEMLDVMLQWLNVWQKRNPGARIVRDEDGQYVAVDAD